MSRDERRVNLICITQTVSANIAPREGKGKEESAARFSRVDPRDQNLSNDHGYGNEGGIFEIAFIAGYYKT